MQRWRRNELIGFASLAALLVSATVALGQLPWAHPIFAGSRATAPCILGFHTGQLTSWNPSDKSAAITLSNSNFTATYTTLGTVLALRANPTVPARHTGKWYFAAHNDAGSTTGWVIGAANSGMPLTHYPGGQDANSVGLYNGNFDTQTAPPQDWAGPNPLGVWTLIALDLDNNLAWGGEADGACVVNPTQWSGPVTTDGNPSTGFHGINSAGLNDGVSVMPAWGGQAGSSPNQVTLYTNTPMTGGTLAGFKYWDQP